MMFGSILKKVRLNAGLSQEELAERVFLSRSAVSRLENDKLELKAADLIRWFQATQAPEMAAAILCGVDITALTDLITNLTTFVGMIII
ncbi:helix-turn-helix transcriptional regulator [Peribacillus frigoritolerans]|uniref:helix-turn-helix domain-containing protein n=1 Tax=Peribacillus frigoritolerans TaxID=450367 RepID=UPI000B750933|nr:Helix-turn-helix domain-containing protein [Bacillus sp. OK838]